MAESEASPGSHEPSSFSSGEPYQRRWQALALLGLAQLMLILDITVVTVALPEMGDDLGLDREALTWVVSAYTLAFGGLMLLGGRAADTFGPTRILLSGLGVFTIASLVAGLATGGEVLIAARAVQGVGAALLSPAALSVLVRIFTGAELNRALGIWSALGGVGAAVGVLLGGVLTAGPGWQWIFFVNVPVGAVVFGYLGRVLPAMPAWAPGRRLDVVGALLGTSATLVVTYAFINAGEDGWTSAQTLVLLVVGGLLYSGFGIWIRRTPHPLVPPTLLGRRTVAAGSLALLVTTALMVSVFFLGTFYLQGVAGHDPLVTGLLFLPVALATMIGAQAAGRLLGRFGARSLAACGLIVAAAGLVVPAVSLGVASTVAAVTIASGGLGVLFVVAAATVLGGVAPDEAGVASAVLSTSHELGSSLGVAVMSGVVAASLTLATGSGFERGYLVAAILALVAAGATSVLIPPTRREAIV
ncbi:MFS transporter [Kribbella sp. NBC_00482]|uniref:MFS transporter n=1 Tax=Kribbella sp. NBC_00482 TaxID=2975968 RepID=UPI002E196AFE